jgi:4-amino-4-deoxy-L-arabinose transferase-like glycosyltransferase
MATLLVLQVLLGTLTVVLTYHLAGMMFGRAAAIVAGLLLAAAPMTARFTAVVLTETLFTFLLILAIASWLRSRSVLGGVALGLATLTRASTLPYLALLLVYGLWEPKRSRRRDAMIVTLIALLTISPWALRNLAQVGRLTIADSSWGGNLFYGTIDLHRGSNRWTQLIAAQTARLSADAMPTQSSPGQGLHSSAGEFREMEAAVTWIWQHPWTWLIVRLRQWPWLFVDTGDYLPFDANQLSFYQALTIRQMSTVALKLTFIGGNAVMFLFALYGAWLLRTQLVRLFALWSFPVYLMLAHLLVYVEPRYGLPLVPFVAIFAAGGICRVIRLCDSTTKVNAMAG